MTVTETVRCAQCWKPKPSADFIGARGGIVQRCAECRVKYRNWKPGSRASEPRRGLPLYRAEHRVIWNKKSGNSKLGRIPSSIVSGETCPSTCSFYGAGCFAEFGPLGYHWRRSSVEGITWETFLARVRELEPGQLWRYAVAGDLPGNGVLVDVKRLSALALANSGRRGFAITHKPLERAKERQVVQAANRVGFTINLSADNLAQADARAELGVGPVVVVLPLGASGDIRTPAGRRVVVCPAERLEGAIDCARCGLCYRADRRGIVGFLPHGNMRETVSRIAARGGS